MHKHLQSLRAYPTVGLEFAKALTQIPAWLRLSADPESESRVPGDYFGINIAASTDPTVDDYLVARLNELGIKQLRMDFSYDSIDAPAQRLLQRLVAEEFSIMLEIFPPLDEARVLHADVGAQQRWRDFLSIVFSQYQHQVEWFEIGSTPNRGKWSGFSFLSYQTAWALAVEQALDVDVVLAGANISDFEPFYNASFLSYMARSGRTPAIHSDNLFVERVIEPEALDHRVFGRFARDYLKLNLLKKARILAAIGMQYGAAQTVCTYKCWTSKRLARRSAWPELKQADYLVRYLALAAVSGALRRVYWGPLICSRDGLISDGITDYPVIDQVSYYQRVRGELADFEVKPAFQALSQTVKCFSNCKVRSLVHQPDGLSIFRFEPPAGNAFLLCWCRDGMGWPLSTVFTEDSLYQAKFTDTLGSQIQRPAVISEHPVYIELADPTQIPVLPSLMPLATADIIHLSSPLRQSITDTEGHWQGATMLRARHQLEDIRNIPTLRPSVLPGLPETAVLRDARNRIWNVSDPRNICGEISVKLNRVAGIKRLTYRFRPSKGQRHWNNACEMLRRGIRTPPPVAFYQRTVRAGINDSWYLCEFIPGAFSAKDVYAAFRKGAEEYRGLEKSQWYDIFAGFVCEMHNKQIVHRDLSAGNLLVAQTETGEIEPYLIDIGRAWTGNGSGLNNRHRLQDLMRICYKLDWTDRAHFIRLYQSHMGKNLPGWWRIPLHYYDYKQKFKKGIKRKGKTRHR